jgi:hypothetical protein
VDVQLAAVRLDQRPERRLITGAREPQSTLLIPTEGHLLTETPARPGTHRMTRIPAWPCNVPPAAASCSSSTAAASASTPAAAAAASGERKRSYDFDSHTAERIYSDYRTHKKHKKRKSFLDELFD